MKLFRFSLFTTICVILLGACGGSTPATPTLSGIDIENTAYAAAFTLIAQTHEALPTNTLAPPTATATTTFTPTNTILPTDTPSPGPTDTATATSTVTAQVGADACNVPLKASPAGKPTKGIKIENATKAPITVSIFLNLTPFGECGYRGYNIAKGGSVTITDLPQGCYNVSAFVNDAKKPTKAFGYGCINNPDKWTFIVYVDFVKLNPP